ncbi:MAG: hypothetical protein PUI29_09385 [Aeromonadales bacterium]|nr:hypothetical protein [Aeromonadales bacterium]MDY2890875.1 hypothetical protein [Succinivibrio sp.]
MAECAIAWLMLCAIVLPLGPLILSSMSADPEVIGDAMERLWWIVPGYALAVPMEVLSGRCAAAAGRCRPRLPRSAEWSDRA